MSRVKRIIIVLCTWGLPIVADAYLEIPLVITKTSKKTIITAEEIKQSGASNIMQVLNGYAGIQIYDLTGDSSQAAVSMRGFGDNAASNSLILINGQPLKNPDMAAPELNTIPLCEVQAIEIIPSSRGIEYGDQAVGGVINIITRNPKARAMEMTLNSGSYHQYGLSANVSHVFDNGFSALLSAYKKHNNNYRRHNDLDQGSLLGQLGYQYDTGEIKLYYQLTDTNQLLAGALTSEQIDKDRRQAINYTDFTQQQTQIFDVSLKQELPNNWQSLTHLSRHYVNGHGFIGSAFTQNRTVTDFTPHIIGKLGKLKITSGIDLEEDNYQLALSTSTNHAIQHEHSLFARFIYPLTQKLQMIAGMRTAGLDGTLTSQNTRMNVKGSAFVNELGISYQLTPLIDLFLRRDGNYRFPKSDENSNTPIGVVGLKTQTGVSYETGININASRFKSNLTFYQLRLNNEIAFDPENTPLQPFGANRNLEPTKRNGATLGFDYFLNEKIKLNSQYSYVDARFSGGNNVGRRIPFVAQNVLRLGANYHFAEPWNLYGEAIYSGNRYASNDDKNQAGLIGGYTVYNLNLSYQIKCLTISGRINNIFNKKYNAYTIYNVSSQTTVYYPAPERNFILTLSISQ